MQQLDWNITLSEDYVPPIIFFRDGQLQDLVEKNWNYYCQGSRSTGKTMTVLQFKKKVENQDHVVYYIKCGRNMSEPFSSALINEGIHLDYWQSRHPMGHLFDTTSANNVTVILDDIQKIIGFKTTNDCLHSLYEGALSAHKKNHRIILVGTTPYLRLLEYLRDDVKSRLILDGLSFPTYQGDELNKILSQRLDLANIEYTSGAISWVSAKLKSLSNDLREGLTLLKEAIRLVWNGEKQTASLTEDLMKQVWEPHKTQYWINTINGMSPDLQAILYSATKVAAEKIKMELSPTSDPPQVTTTEINAVYHDLCKRKNEEPMYLQKISYNIRMLCEPRDFLWFEEIISKGRYGRIARFSYGANAPTILKAFQAMGWE